jgi:hypothetical protein
MMGAGFGLDLRFELRSGLVRVVRCVAERMEEPLTVRFRLLFCLLRIEKMQCPAKHERLSNTSARQSSSICERRKGLSAAW